MGEQLPVVSLFSGAGGLDLAVERADAEPLVENTFIDMSQMGVTSAGGE